jgi:hypothetical protein
MLSAVLYRQPALDDWDSVVERVRQDLSRLARHDRAGGGRPAAPAIARSGRNATAAQLPSNVE